MKIQLSALILSTISLIMSIVGIVIPYWTYASNDGATSARGLWHGCDAGDRESIDCFSAYETVPTYIHAVRALELIGVAFDVFAILCGVVRLLFKKDNVKLLLTAGASIVAAGVFLLLGILVFVVNFVESSDNMLVAFHFGLSAGFGLCAGAGILSAIAGILYLIAYCRKQFNPY